MKYNLNKQICPKNVYAKLEVEDNWSTVFAPQLSEGGGAAPRTALTNACWITG